MSEDPTNAKLLHSLTTDSASIPLAPLTLNPLSAAVTGQISHASIPVSDVSDALPISVGAISVKEPNSSIVHNRTEEKTVQIFDALHKTQQILNPPTSAFETGLERLYDVIHT